jgi:hypothetical protein
MKAFLGRKKIFYSVKNGKHRDLLEVKPMHNYSTQAIGEKRNYKIKSKGCKIFFAAFF